MSHSSYLALKIIQQKVPHFTPKVGIVLGSGLGGFAKELKNCITIDYHELPGFPEVTVLGHKGQLVLGYLGDIPVACLQGRAHSYEGSVSEVVKTYVRTLRLLGCEYFIATNAAGSLRLEAGPGSLMLINDHINLQPTNPLIGPNDEAFGPRFLPLDDAYNEAMRNRFLRIAEIEQITLHQGVYIAVLGPNYETAAEIRAFKSWGADAVGMSTVPEVLVAHHCGMKVSVISTITNYATGLTHCSHSHEAVVAMAAEAASKLTRLVKACINDIYE